MKKPLMPRPQYFTGPEILVLLDSPAFLTNLADGGVQIEKAGIIGTGPTVTHAVAMWGRKFSDMLATIAVIEGCEPAERSRQIPAFA
jgi:hypothetical protein